MKRTTVFSLFFITLGLLSSCGSDGESSNTKKNKNNLMGNPFAEESTLDFQVPDFDKIKNEHFRPALEEGMRIQLEEIEAIANNEERSEEHTSELQSRPHLVCRLLLEKK